MQTQNTSQIQPLLDDKNLLFPDCPALLRDVLFLEMPGGYGVQIRGSGPPVLLVGRDAAASIRFLREVANGSYTLPQILRRRPASLPLASLEKAIFQLHRNGQFREGKAADKPDKNNHKKTQPLSADSTSVLFWERYLNVTGYNKTAEHVQDSITQSTITVVGEGAFGTATIDLLRRQGFQNLLPVNILYAEKLKGEGLGGEHILKTDLLKLRYVLEKHEASQLVLICTRHASSIFLSGANEILLNLNKPFLISNETDDGYEIGPLVFPMASGCFECKKLRAIAMSKFSVEEEIYQRELQTKNENPRDCLNGENSVAAFVAAGLVVNEATRVVTQIAPPTLIDKVIRFDSIRGTIESNRFHRVPHCPACMKTNNITIE